jgi:DNA-binding NtrC family response regulator
MRTPGMNGAEFLAASRKIVPNARRILLTGDTGIESAVAGVNQVSWRIVAIDPKSREESIRVHYVHFKRRQLRKSRAVWNRIVGSSSSPRRSFENYDFAIRLLNLRTIIATCDVSRRT